MGYESRPIPGNPNTINSGWNKTLELHQHNTLTEGGLWTERSYPEQILLNNWILLDIHKKCWEGSRRWGREGRAADCHVGVHSPTRRGAWRREREEQINRAAFWQMAVHDCVQCWVENSHKKYPRWRLRKEMENEWESGLWERNGHRKILLALPVSLSLSLPLSLILSLSLFTSL
jgi:hypothetical protein